jgi:hypothetical protein
MKEIRISVKGIESIRGLKNFPSVFRNEASKAVRESIYTIEAKAKPETPVLTGRLRGSIRPDYIRTLDAKISPHTDYAIYVHEGLGSSKRKGRRPFMEIGAKLAMPQIQKFFNKAIDKTLKQCLK